MQLSTAHSTLAAGEQSTESQGVNTTTNTS